MLCSDQVYIDTTQSPYLCFKDPVETPESFELEESLFAGLHGTDEDLLTGTGAVAES